MKAESTPRSQRTIPPAGAVALLVATRKGGFILRSDKARDAWRIVGPSFFGHVVHHMVLDARPNAKGGRTLLACDRRVEGCSVEYVGSEARVTTTGDSVPGVYAVEITSLAPFQMGERKELFRVSISTLSATGNRTCFAAAHDGSRSVTVGLTGVTNGSPWFGRLNAVLRLTHGSQR